MLTLPGRADHAMWEQSDLLQEEQDEVNGVEHRAMELGGGPDQFQVLSEEEQEALIAQAVEETFRRLRGRQMATESTCDAPLSVWDEALIVALSQLPSECECAVGSSLTPQREVQCLRSTPTLPTR